MTFESNGIQMESHDDQHDRLLTLFHAYDVDNSGRIEKDEFLQICSELHVRSSETEAIFAKLDTDRDGSINLQEFLCGFRRVSDLLSGEDMESDDNFSPAWEDFQTRMGDLAKYIAKREQTAILHQNISMTEPRLVPQYERVVLNFTREIKLQTTEMEHLALAVKRAHDQASMQLSEMEEEMDQRIHAAERSTRIQEVKRSESALNELRQQYDTQVYELQQKIRTLQVAEEQNRTVTLKDEASALKKKNNQLTLDNQRLKQEVLESHTNIAFLQSELVSLKSDLTDHSINSERDEALMHCFSEERGNLERQIEMLQSANRKLHDSNDALRSALENSQKENSKIQQMATPSPGDHASRHKSFYSPHRCCHGLCPDDGFDSPLQQSSLAATPDGLHRPGCEALALALCDPMRLRRRSCEQDSLAESCLDSGRSTLRGSYAYDSEQEGYRQEAQHQDHHQDEHPITLQHADSLDTDTETVDVHDEIPLESDSESVLEWRSHKIEKKKRETNRRCLSAIFTEPEIELDRSKPASSERAYRVVLAGDAAVGKSSFLLRLCKNEFTESTKATLGVDFQMKTLVVDGEPTVLQLWDTAGQERFRSIAKSYFRRADGVLLLYDVTCERSFLNVREWVDMIEDVSQDDIPIMLVGNKCDLRPEAMQDGIVCIPTSYGEKLAMTYSALFCETSAKDGSNIIEAVLHLAREVTKHAQEKINPTAVTSLTGNGNKKLPNLNCCT
ncbi:ras and EF-hand domain-containing protein homolog isoform X2 [Engraulis encrasicolus]|uniref:ras and EF-hand domain-containing protein homolog isoform X2 n=1 Tax=Engraulis encrasicolus TaxID=184585 RepID=UPI002FD740A2